MDSQDHKISSTSTGHDGHGVGHGCTYATDVDGLFQIHIPVLNREDTTRRFVEQLKDIKSSILTIWLFQMMSMPRMRMSIHQKNTEEIGSSGGVGWKSNRSEDDVYSDAVTEFSDSGISPRLEERFESVSTNVDKNTEQKSLEGDLYGSESLNLDGFTVGSALPITDTSAEAATSVGHVNGLQPDVIKSEILKDVVVDSTNEYGDGGVLEGQVKATLDSEEGKVSDLAPTADESKENLRDELVSKVVKHDQAPKTQTLQNLETVEFTEETHENVDASVGVKEISHSTEHIGSIGAVAENNLPEESLLGTPSVKPSESTQISDVTELSESKPVASSIDIEVEQKTALAGGEIVGSFDASKAQKCDVNGNEKQNLETKDDFSFDTGVASVSADNTFVPEDDQITRAFEKDDVVHSEEVSDSKLLETSKMEGAPLEVQQVLDSTMPSDNSTDFPSSCEADSDAIHLQELSKTESRGNDFDKPSQGLGTDKVTEELQSVVSAGLDQNPDIGYISQVITEPPNNTHVTSSVVRVESADVAGIVTELEDECEVEQPKSKESTSLFTDSEVLTESSANNNSCTSEGAELSSKLNHGDNVVVSSETSESPTKKRSNETSPVVEERHSSEDVGASKSVVIVLSEEPTCDVNVVTSDECLKEPVPSPSDVQILHETSDTVDDKNVINVEDVSGVNSKSLQDEVDNKLTKQKDGVADMDLSASLISRSDSLDANCGSVSAVSSQSNIAVADTNSQSPDALETNSQMHKTTTEDKSDVFEPPSFMTLVQSGGECNQVSAVSEIEAVQNNQQPDSHALQAGWFPSITNVLNESEGRKKNEEIIAKVTKQHNPLKSLLNEVKSPNTKQVPAENQKEDEIKHKDNGDGVTTVSSVLNSEVPKDQDNNKDMEVWNSPARYPVEIKKEKKKKAKSYWVPFVCCSSVHRDL
ncbi:hypothetical protein DH2020_005003 [Rehmannia glutinosa]|uniref:Uncharacterized protein n=1 Tax=Rehmannia glutinosa TaxID=99300 RepID=A0ABR0XQZ2_REHGL